FFSSRRRHTRFSRDWSSDVCSSDLYFLTQFADQGAHDGGEFFTPVSLVQLIVNVLEPDHGKIFDPACGSGGMFVQSAHFMERHRSEERRVGKECRSRWSAYH